MLTARRAYAITGDDCRPERGKPECPLFPADRPTHRWLRARVRPPVAGNRRLHPLRFSMFTSRSGALHCRAEGGSMSAPHAFAIESLGRSAGIVVAERGGFMVFAANAPSRRWNGGCSRRSGTPSAPPAGCWPSTTSGIGSDRARGRHLGFQRLRRRAGPALRRSVRPPPARAR